MKPRRVTVTLTVETDAPVSVLCRRLVWGELGLLHIQDEKTSRLYAVDVVQVQAEAASAKRGRKRA